MAEYQQFKPEELGDHYYKHVDAMTREGLHSKADIARELAYRDAQIELWQSACDKATNLYEKTLLGEVSALKSNRHLYEAIRILGDEIQNSPENADGSRLLTVTSEMWRSFTDKMCEATECLRA